MSKVAETELIKYLINNGVQVIPLAPGKKYPTFKNWENYYTALEDVSGYINSGHGFGIKPNGEWLYVDLDGDHVDGVDGVKTYYSIVPRETIKTLYAKKANSRNVHLFYRNNHRTKMRLTGNQAILPGVELSARDSQVRIFPDYEFKNLDLTRPFLDQMEDTPRQLEPVLTPVDKGDTYRTQKQRGNNIKAYLKKVQPFDKGGRSSGYRKLIFVMVVKWGMNYDEVKPAVDAWDLKNGGFQLEEPSQYEHATRLPDRS